MDQDREAQKPEEKQLRGLYRHVKISVKTLDKIIIVLLAALVGCMAFGMTHRGYTVTFDACGGTHVESQTRMYGETVQAPEPPTREGYVFTGWYREPDCAVLWNLETEQVTESVTLYAGWAPIQ